MPRMPNTVAADANVVIVQYFFTAPATILITFADNT